MYKIGVAVILSCLAAPALAQSDTAAKPAPEKPKKICRAETATGSIFTKRVCHSAAEWQQIDAVNSRAAEAMRNRPTGT